MLPELLPSPGDDVPGFPMQLDGSAERLTLAGSWRIPASREVDRWYLLRPQTVPCGTCRAMCTGWMVARFCMLVTPV